MSPISFTGPQSLLGQSSIWFPMCISPIIPLLQDPYQLVRRLFRRLQAVSHTPIDPSTAWFGIAVSYFTLVGSLSLVSVVSFCSSFPSQLSVCVPSISFGPSSFPCFPTLLFDACFGASLSLSCSALQTACPSS